MPDDTLDEIRTAGWREGAAEATVLQVSRASLAQMTRPKELPSPSNRSLRAPPDKNPEDPTIGKWAVLTLADHADAARKWLAPLIEHRRQLGQLWGEGVVAIRRSESGSVESWLRKIERVVGDHPPHYWLCLGGPEELPFSLQYELDLTGLTGRLDASDHPGGAFSWEACRRYAGKVVDYEHGRIGVDAKPLFYSASADRNTRVSHEYLVQPLAATVAAGVTPLYDNNATVDRLLSALDTERAPKLVFTASHGVEQPRDAVRWGALTDANYRGRTSDAVVSATAIEGRNRVGYGSIVFSFACYSAGVPQQSVVWFLTDKTDQIEEFQQRVSPLPRQLLGHRHGPVAFVGHVDQVSGVAFQKSYGMVGIDPYDHFIGWLGTKGGTLGQAMGTFRDQTKRIGSQIAAALEAATASEGQPADAKAAGRKWIGFNDYRGFMLIGDPALTPMR